MATVPTLPYMPAGHVATQSDMQAISNAYTFLISGKPYAVACASSVQTGLVANTPNPIKFQTKLMDNDGIFTSGGNPPFTIQTPGWYRCKAFVPLASANFDGALWVITGSGNPQGAGISTPCWPLGATVSGNSSDYTAASGGGLLPFYLYATDTVTAQIAPNSSGSTAMTDQPATISIEWVSS